jgi:hypothetical protein
MSGAHASWIGRLEAAWARSDEVFATLSPAAFSLRPIALRHPLLFYLGHLPAFAYNQIVRGALGEPPLDAALDSLFERGIDPESESDAVSLSSWPSVAEVLAYRDRVRELVRERVPSVLAKRDDLLCDKGRVLSLVIEHELMHHETLQYLFAQCPEGAVTRAGNGAARRALRRARLRLGQRVRSGGAVGRAVLARRPPAAKSGLARLYG